MVTKIYRDHKKYQEYKDNSYIQSRPEKEERKKKEKKREPIDDRLVCRVSVTHLYKVKKEFIGLIRAGDPQGYVTLDNARDSLLAYC